MKWVLLLFLPSFNLIAQEDAPFEARLYSIEASKEGAYTTKWEKAGEGSTRTNKIFIKNLPDSVATGDDWSGNLQRNGAHILEDGTKIPQFMVFGGSSSEATNSQIESKPPEVPAVQNNSTNNPAHEAVIPMTEIEKGVFIVEAGKSSGTGFLLNEPTGVYFYSNIHVFSTPDKAMVRNSKGDIIEIPKMIEVAEGEDLLRFKTSKDLGLAKGESLSLSERVYSLGNSGGGGVVTKNPGEVLGLGDSTFEVSCEIVPGNSGGPITDKGGKVYGVASFMTYGRDTLATEGTRYSKARRFGIALNRPLKWESIDYGTFRKEAKFINAINESLQVVLDCWDSIDSDKAMMSFKVSNDLPSPARAQSKLDNIVRYHNREYIDYYGNKSAKEMWGYMTTQLKETCEVIISENKASLNSNWGKTEYEQSKEWATRLAKAIATHREKIRKSF